MLAAAAAVWLVYVSVVVPWTGTQPNNIRELVAKVKALNKPVALLHVDSARIDFYLDGPHASFGRLSDALQWTRRHDGVLITSEPVSDSGFAVLTSTHRFHVVTAKAAPADHGTNLGNGIDRRPSIPPADVGSRP
jgi:hypothetical protein